MHTRERVSLNSLFGKNWCPLSPEKDSEYPGSREEGVVVNNFAHFLTESDTHNMTDYAYYGSHFRDRLYHVLNLPNVPTSL